MSDPNVKVQGVLKVVEARLSHEVTAASTGVGGLVIFEDEAGNKWETMFAQFLWDLQPFVENQPSYSDWIGDVIRAKSASWSNKTYSKAELFAAYRAGKTPEDLYPLPRWKQSEVSVK